MPADPEAQDDTGSTTRRRLPRNNASYHNPSRTTHYSEEGNDDKEEGLNVSEVPFAGRIGGNQEFTLDPNDEDAQAILKKRPDAAPIQSASQAVRLRGFRDPVLWRMAITEAFATCLLVFSLGAAASGLSFTGATPMAISLYTALLNFVGLSIFILAAAPASGGHLNPLITMATFFVGLSSLPRAVLYVSAQSIGAIVAGFWLKACLGDSYFPDGTIPGCNINPDVAAIGQLFALEMMFAQALIFTVFGVGLDPRQGNVFGPALSPILVGATIAFGVLASSIVKPGYSGVALNPARCLGLMAGTGNLQYHYIHWLAPLAAAMINGLFYFYAPPYVKDKSLKDLAAERQP